MKKYIVFAVIGLLFCAVLIRSVYADGGHPIASNWDTQSPNNASEHMYGSDIDVHAEWEIYDDRLIVLPWSPSIQVTGTISVQHEGEDIGGDADSAIISYNNYWGHPRPEFTIEDADAGVYTVYVKLKYNVYGTSTWTEYDSWYFQFWVEYPLP